MSSLAGNGIIQQKITDKSVLYSVYMPFVKGGGLFMPIGRKLTLGAEVFVSLVVLDKRFGVGCKVIWVTPSLKDEGDIMQLGGSPASQVSMPYKSYMRASGIGVQFVSGEHQEALSFIETQLTGQLNSALPTQTM